LEGQIEFAEGNLFGPVVGRRFELVVSNPPYLAESERSQLAPELAHEPEVALFAGPDGLAVLRELVAGATAFLAPGGGFAVELAPDQAPTVAHWLREAGLGDVITHRDLAARPRVVSARGPHLPESENI
jgi:release factor glutamine methyltransferase